MADSIWLYNPSLALSILFTVLYTIPTTIQLYQTTVKYKAHYFLVVSIGCCLELGGYVARCVSIHHPSEIPPYATQSSLIIIAPIFFAAGNYLLITRLCPPSLPRIFRIPIRNLTRIFVSCDVVLFLIQASGSGIAASGNWEGRITMVGKDVLIVGLASQLVTFVFFVGIVVRVHSLAKGKEGEGGMGWKRVLWAVYGSSGLIIIRSTYRLIEFALGIRGYPFTHDWTFCVFESVPMLGAVGVFCVWHPGAYFGPGKKRGFRDGGEIQMDGRTSPVV
ncbi:putative RTA1 domain protein [Mollisia scopiformis]|uniref:Putative RTA1 domain protein n=1 Tax=Mollisia scopiformis TaxID=149040 RepID=A0A194WS42_MOLSC|nr:putative RTA1 domain protein [Mollisia scopiformis]KUJ10795.1 putative RTA1 domain protein [Mollisia scopiformis]